MKSYKFHIITFIAAFLAVGTVWGQTTVSGTWAGGALTGSYKLTGNTTLTGTISVSSATLTIDLNGYTLDRQSGGFVATVSEQRTLNIKDSSNGKGVIKNGRGDRGGAFHVGGILNIQGGIIQDCISTDGKYDDTTEESIHYHTQGAGGAIYIQQGGIVNMSGGTIKNCKTEKLDGTFGRGGAVFVDAEVIDGEAVVATFNMTGGTITGCQASWGGAVYVHQAVDTQDTEHAGVFKMSGTATITNCTSKNEGGGVYIAGGSISMSGGTISACTGTKGGGVYIPANATFNMTGGTITGCRASSLGSGIYTLGKLNISGSAIIDSNKPSNWDAISYTDGYPQVKSGGVYGGGIYALGENAIIDMSGGRISNNWAPSGAGVMLWEGSTMTMTGGEISGNYALGTGGLGNGGAVYVQTATLNLNGGTLKNNTAIRYGGAVNLNRSGVLNLEGPCTITGNKACHGGGISQEAEECILTLNHPGITISNNTAHGHQDSMNDSGVHTLSRGKGNGGGLFIEKGTLTINGGTISGNSATGHGGGASIYVKRIHGGNTKAIINSGTISGNSAEYGGGLDLYADTAMENGMKSNLLVQLKDGTVSGNRASQSGAGIYMSFNESNSTAKMEVGTASSTPVIQNNIATLNGGGLGMSNNGVFDVKNANMSGNTASIGGAIWLGSGTFTLSNATLTNNIASQNGGGIYVGSGTFTVNGTATLKGNKATYQSGGGIYLGGGTFTVSQNGVLNLGGANQAEGNIAGSFGGGVFCGAPFTVNGTSTIQNNSAANGGGVYINTGYSASFAKQMSLLNNTATGDGGGLYVAGGSVTMTQNTISGNNAANGGAVYLTGGSIKATGASTIQNNYSSENGGAYYVSGGSVTMTSATISGNGKNNGTATTTNGGAVFVTGNGAGFTASGATEITSNASKGDGGAVYVSGGNISLDENIISNNNAANGGAIYVNGGGFTANGGTEIKSNTATGNGGAVYVTGTSTTKGNININGNSSNSATITGNYSTGEGGAFYVNNGDITMGLTELSGNGKDASSVVHTSNGGAIALKNGTFSFADGSEIKDNHAKGNGGGLYISNESATRIRCIGGSYINNSAGYGGGLYASGPITLQFAANMQSNRAVNGGGMYLTNGIDMTFGVNETDLKLSGLIVGNEAKGEGENGVGGGVYLAEGRLQFALSDDFKDLGIYNNSASFEAADIYSRGGGVTTVYLPNISGMNLTGFDVPGSDLYWVRDFSEQRYETLLRNNQDIAELIVHFNSESTLILESEQCLDLGYDLVFVTLTPVGLDSFDNAAVMISYPHKITGEPEQYRKVVLHGKEQQIVGLPSNHWQFDATPWSFTYEIPSYDPQHATETSGTEKKGYILIKRGCNQEIKISFSQNNTQKSYVTHDVLVVNPMRPGGQVN